MVKIKLFASYKERIGKEIIEYKIEGEITVKELLDKISREYKIDLDNCLVAKGFEYIKPEEKVRDEDLIYILPPVSGGFFIFR